MAKLVSRYTVMHCLRSALRTTGYPACLGAGNSSKEIIAGNDDLSKLMGHPQIV